MSPAIRTAQHAGAEVAVRRIEGDQGYHVSGTQLN